MRKSMTILFTALATLSFAATASTTVLPSQNGHYNDQLCYLKQQAAPVHYTSQASEFGYSRHQLRKLEKNWTCKNGQLLGDVQNQWVLRNPS